MMFRIGAHMSVSDGFDAAVRQQESIGGTCGQIFVGSPRGWAVSEIGEEDATAFRQANSDHDMGPWMVHGTYLINFATPKDDLGDKSVRCVQEELDACERLDIPYYVFHPGSHTEAGRDRGIENVARRLSKLEIPNTTTLLLENTAGSGTSLGRDLEELARMVNESAFSLNELGVCLDTCHLHAAGYEFRTDDGIEKLTGECEENFGLENVHYLHLNDSKHDFASEKDEHEHIGAGSIGAEGFRRVINSPAFRDKPMVLETPENGIGYEENIEKCKSLRQSASESDW